MKRIFPLEMSFFILCSLILSRDNIAQEEPTSLFDVSQIYEQTKKPVPIKGKSIDRPTIIVTHMNSKWMEDLNPGKAFNTVGVNKLIDTLYDKGNGPFETLFLDMFYKYEYDENGKWLKTDMSNISYKEGESEVFIYRPIKGWHHFYQTNVNEINGSGENEVKTKRFHWLLKEQNPSLVLHSGGGQLNNQVVTTNKLIIMGGYFESCHMRSVAESIFFYRGMEDLTIYLPLDGIFHSNMFTMPNLMEQFQKTSIKRDFYWSYLNETLLPYLQKMEGFDNEKYVFHFSSPMDDGIPLIYGSDDANATRVNIVIASTNQLTEDFSTKIEESKPKKSFTSSR